MEIIIVCVQAIAIDIFSSAIGFNLLPLPRVEKGYPPRNRPSEAKIGPAWVATISPEDALSDFSDFYSNESQFYIRRSMTLVKKGSRHLWDLLNHLYLEDPRLPELEGLNRGVSRAQM